MPITALSEPLAKHVDANETRKSSLNMTVTRFSGVPGLGSSVAETTICTCTIHGLVYWLVGN